jgi:hypothetical protein
MKNECRIFMNPFEMHLSGRVGQQEASIKLALSKQMM